MLISSSRGIEGDRAYFISPLKHTTKPMNYSFYLFMDSQPDDKISRFEIYKTEYGVMTEHLLLVLSNEGHPDWQFRTLIIPEGIYSLTLVGVMGRELKSDIGLASIQTSDTDENPKIQGNSKLFRDCNRKYNISKSQQNNLSKVTNLHSPVTHASEIPLIAQKTETILSYLF